MYGLVDTDNIVSNRRNRSMVLNSRSDGNLCGSSDPDCDHGWSAGSRQVGDCSMVTPELEEDILMDEVLSDLSCVRFNGDHVSGYLRISQQGTLGTFDCDWRD